MSTVFKLNAAMPTAFSADAHSIANVFSDPHYFGAPAYQRRFCWTTAEGGRLLDDLLSAYDEAQLAGQDVDHDYFLGAILLVDPRNRRADKTGDDRNTETTRFDIVDGQQRLVTVAILIAVLRDLLETAHASLSDKLQSLITGSRSLPHDGAMRVALRNEDGAFLVENVMLRGACQKETDDFALNEAQQSILDLRTHFVAQLVDRDAVELVSFATYLIERCSVVLIVTNHIDRAHRMFTVLNDTGKQLKRNEILKAEMIGDLPAAEAGHYQTVWDALELQLGGDFEALFSQIRAVNGRSGTHIMAGIRTQVAQAGGAARFIDERTRAVRARI